MRIYKEIAYNLIALEYPDRWQDLPSNLFNKIKEASNLKEMTALLLIA
jgi:hypothetical protein